HQTTRCISANIKHAPPHMHQMRVTQLIGTGLESKRCEDRAETTRSGSIRKTISRGGKPESEKPCAYFA
ncbi:MAG: hypothetical protein DME40_17680, partial [Verrucomicrobia bacterium]